MRDSTLVRLARSIALTGAVSGVGGVAATTIFTDHREDLWRGVGMSVLLAGFFGVFVWLVIPKQPRNAVVWAMAISGLGGGIYLGGFALAALIVEDPDLVLGDVLIPARVPTAVSVLAMLSVVGVYVALYAWLTFGLLLFPDGMLPTSRWRWVAGLAIGGLLLLAASAIWEYRPWSTVAVTEDTVLATIGGGAATFAALASLGALVLRFRHSTGVLRDQFKWVVWAAALLVPWFAAAFFVGGTPHEDAVLIPLHIALAVMLGAYGIAVGKYRLFDIDVVISRTVVYGSLAVFITVAYVGVVTGLGQLLGGGPEPNPVLAVGMTAVVAVAFHPLRRRLQRSANRLVYGKKATPYEVLSEFSHRVAAADSSLPDRVARSLVEGTGADRAAVWVDVDGELAVTARWPQSGDELEGEDTSFPIEQDGVELGRLTLGTPAGQRLAEEDLRLAGEVASGMGLALRNQLLTRTLQARIEELRGSRRRLVAVQDDTRRRLERDLHDGAQQQLVALKVKLGLAQAIARQEGGTRTVAALQQLSAEADAAVDGLRDFARGVYPPLLEAEGLGAALTALARRFPIPVMVTADAIERHDPQVETTVYFCVVEALQNAVRHANASSVRVRLSRSAGTLDFEVADDGRGFHPDEAGRGSGLANMEIRLDVANGSLTIDSMPGQGTSVCGSIPVVAP